MELVSSLCQSISDVNNNRIQNVIVYISVHKKMSISTLDTKIIQNRL
jgi:hypothetical protein